MTLSVAYTFGLVQSNATLNVTLPGGSAAGDMCVVEMAGYPSDTSNPTGFTAGDYAQNSDSAEMRTAWKTLTGTDISNNFVTMPGSPDFNDVNCAIWVAHSDLGNPVVDGHTARWAFDGSSPNTVYDSGTITVAATGNVIVCVLMGGRGGTGGNTWSSTPGGVTIDQNAPSNAIHTLAYHYTFTGPGTTSAQTATCNWATDRETAAVIGVAEPVVGPVTSYIRQARSGSS